ncbi:putative glycoside hydrolase [Actinospongicola halichondriae]|uniref:putative glycoside hydrolase n=1 Tax=Actinospongicola halichondriae TaxID=3236844 RepID=UPI003D4D476F
MPSDHPTHLRGIPGAGSSGRSGRRSSSPGGPQFRPPLIGDPRRGRRPEPRRPFRRRSSGPKAWSPRRQPRSIPWSTLLIALGFALLGFFVWQKFWDATRVDVVITGIEDQAELTLEEASDLHIEIDIEQLDLEAGVTPTVFFDGVELDDETHEVSETGITWDPPPLEEGVHVLAMSIGRPLLDDAKFTWTFAVDGTPPFIDVVSPQPAAPICTPVSVTGRIETGLASFQIDGEDAEVDENGSFTLEFDQAPLGPVLLTAEDQAGNKAAAEIVIPVEYPSTQGIHVTAAAWGYDPLREHVLALVDAGKVSAVELDIKDEGGIVGYDTDVDLAHEIGAVRQEYVLKDAIDLLHAKGVRVIGRVVAFRDGPLAAWAETNGRMDYVIQDNDGAALSKYGGFTNVANADVRKYNIDLAEEAIDRGVDEILWDYVRRPEGDIEGMVFPGLQVADPSPEAEKRAVNDNVVSFLAESGRMVRDRCVYQGASLFGIAARNPDAIGQPVPGIARNVDYIAPMLYPSHWVRGEYRVDHPNAQPYDIVEKSLSDFQRKAAGSGVAFNLWVQDFSIGIPYGPEEVRAQIQAARDLGVDNWLLWNATVRYTPDAITPEMVHRPDGTERPGS